MIYKVMGDILSFQANIICHQTNYWGNMTEGIAAAICRSMIFPEEFEEYKFCCRRFHEQMLGMVLYSTVIPGEKYVANCFCQREEVVDGTWTDYDALLKCMQMVESGARLRHWNVALPAHMGCGLSGGDWKRVMHILAQVFQRSPVSLTIVYREEDRIKWRRQAQLERLANRTGER